MTGNGLVSVLLRNAMQVGLLTSLAGAGALASGQTVPEYRYNGSGYATFGVGPCQHGITNISFAGGADGFLWRGLTVGGEIGSYQFVERNGQLFGIGAVNLGYHFVDRKTPGKLEPFLSIGIIGAGFRPGGVARSGGVGGGVNYWFRRRVGLRTEARVTGFGSEAIMMLRVGFSFR